MTTTTTTWDVSAHIYIHMRKRKNVYKIQSGLLLTYNVTKQNQTFSYGFVGYVENIYWLSVRKYPSCVY